MNLFRSENKERKKQEEELREVVLPAFKRLQAELGWIQEPQLNPTHAGIFPVSAWRPMTEEEKKASQAWLAKQNVGNKEVSKVPTGNGETS